MSDLTLNQGPKFWQRNNEQMGQFLIKDSYRLPKRYLQLHYIYLLTNYLDSSYFHISFSTSKKLLNEAPLYKPLGSLSTFQYTHGQPVPWTLISLMWPLTVPLLLNIKEAQYPHHISFFSTYSFFCLGRSRSQMTTTFCLRLVWATFDDPATQTWITRPINTINKPCQYIYRGWWRKRNNLGLCLRSLAKKNG